ncbi:hypothetical protein [Nesterenkonia populi]|uniref:phage scaffolding protein n=1 Tax=Nesterenkonia populi TaxID=1591087 RepID=UPI001B870064|nr:hypothetical protein [Nesterenkonia populi]
MSHENINPASQDQPDPQQNEPTQDEPAGTGEQDNWQEKFEAQRKVNRDLEKKLKGEAGTLKQQLEEAQAKLEGREEEFKQTQAQREAEAEALQKANERIRQAEVRAAAAGKLNDPTDALRLLDLSSFEVGDDGAVDGDAIQSAIADLITQKPYLAAQGGWSQGDGIGAGRKDSRPSQLSQSDLSGMSPAQINTARAEGRLDDLLGRR